MQYYISISSLWAAIVNFRYAYMHNIVHNNTKYMQNNSTKYMHNICNASLTQGCLPLSQRHAIVSPRLKKVGAVTDVKNYRPVSNLTFILKIVERVVCNQLVAYLEQNQLLPKHQSAYQKFHSTETAVLKLVSDILFAADGAEVTLLGILDLLAAFDTVDHTILLDRLRVSFGLGGSVLSWITSFIWDRIQTVVFNQERSIRSRTVLVTSGVPQGSVLGPLLFLLYTADVLLIPQRHGLKAHSYADDIQIHCSGKAVSAMIVIFRVVACINDIGEWMTGNRF